jgi:hypothetical protein
MALLGLSDDKEKTSEKRGIGKAFSSLTRSLPLTASEFLIVVK